MSDAENNMDSIADDTDSMAEDITRLTETMSETSADIEVMGGLLAELSQTAVRIEKLLARILFALVIIGLVVIFAIMVGDIT